MNILIHKYHLKRTNKWIVQYHYSNELFDGFADFDTDELANEFIKVNNLIPKEELNLIPEE